MNTKEIRKRFEESVVRLATWLNKRDILDNPETEVTATLEDFYDLFFDGYKLGHDQAVKDMEATHVFYWETDEETNLSDAVISELKEIAEDDDEAISEFSWGNEDNECYPAIAEYVGEKYNQYRFMIDLRPFLPSNLVELEDE